MQTFLPYSNFDASARCLDPRRLGNQAYNEGLQILQGKWPNHPASKMWNGYRYSLCEYLLACFAELANRGLYYPTHIATVQQIQSNMENTGKPYWLGNKRLHETHRASLLFKNPNWYSSFGWGNLIFVSYYWPRGIS